MKLIDLVTRIAALTDKAPYAIVGGLAQVLWARKTHTDDFDVAVASPVIAQAEEKLRRVRAPHGWKLPKSPPQNNCTILERRSIPARFVARRLNTSSIRPPRRLADWAPRRPKRHINFAAGSKDPVRAHESDETFEVLHVSYRGSVVDLISFHDQKFMNEILSTARTVSELGGYCFIRPELLLVTHLLRPTVEAALAAVELILVQRRVGGFDESYAKRWANRLKRREAFARTLARAMEIANASR